MELIPNSSSAAVIWVIDDTPANHRLVERSLPPSDGSYKLINYHSGQDALDELEVFLSDFEGAAHLPDVIFMDYYLGETNGGQVTVTLRKLFDEYKLQGPYIIGHSSMYSCSEVIKTLGGDIAITKNPRKEKSRDIVSLFPDLSSIALFAGRGRQRIPQ
ncbi:MAG: response regulator [Planctomycetota bacterium]|nr:response regulator [Planctomycetota bacterium]